MSTLFWIQTGACGGDSLAILGAEAPTLEQLLTDYSIELLWHPSLSHAPTKRFDALIEQIAAGQQVLNILCVEGSIVTAPRGTGLYDSHRGVAKMTLVRTLAEMADVVVAMGTCAAFGGVHAADRRRERHVAVVGHEHVVRHDRVGSGPAHAGHEPGVVDRGLRHREQHDALVDGFTGLVEHGHAADSPL